MLSARLLPGLAMLAAVLAMEPRPARAITPDQITDIDRLAEVDVPGKTRAYAMAAHYAMLLWVEDYCSGESDESVRRYIMAKGKGDEMQFEAGWGEAMAMLTASNAPAMCALAEQQYGPDGALIRNGWRKKAATR